MNREITRLSLRETLYASDENPTQAQSSICLNDHEHDKVVIRSSFLLALLSAKLKITCKTHVEDESEAAASCLGLLRSGGGPSLRLSYLLLSFFGPLRFGW